MKRHRALVPALAGLFLMLLAGGSFSVYASLPLGSPATLAPAPAALSVPAAGPLAPRSLNTAGYYQAALSTLQEAAVPPEIKWVKIYCTTPEQEGWLVLNYDMDEATFDGYLMGSLTDAEIDQVKRAGFRVEQASAAARHTSRFVPRQGTPTITSTPFPSNTPTPTPRMSQTVIQQSHTATWTATQTQVVSPTPTCVQATPTWTEVATITIPGRYSAAGVVGNDGQFWVVGGSDENNNPIANTDAFDPATNFWDSYTPLPGPRSQLAAGRLGGWIVVGGGLVSPSSITASVDAYNVSANAWQHFSDAPYAFTGAMGAGYELTNRFFIFGGQTSPFTTTNEVLIYDVAGNSWSYAAPMPAPRSNGAAAQWGDKLYVFGGADDNRNAVNTLWEYDPASNQWIVKSPAPVARFQPAMSARNGKLYVTGGNPDPLDPTAPTYTVEVYDIGTDTWTTASRMVRARQGHVQGTLGDGRIIAATGLLTTAFRGRFAEVLPPGDPCVPIITPTSTPTSGSPTATPTQCTINFSDVQPGDYFYEDVRCVYCLGAVSGYSDGTFRPFNNTTRGQMTKIIVIALDIPIVTPTGGPTFNDVPTTNPFYAYIETAAANSIVSGYNCGGPGEPCPGTYFRPFADVTRGQLSKIVVVAANQVFGWEILNPPTATFSDVPAGSAFYVYVETAVCHGVVSGYADGTFRPFNNAIRAQIAKIVCRTSQNPPSTCLVRSSAGR